LTYNRTLVMLKQDFPSVYVEAENFHHKGGWVVDQQFMDLIGKYDVENKQIYNLGKTLMSSHA